MSETFFTYLHRLESIAFFSGYPLIYSIVLSIRGNRPAKNSMSEKVFSLLPFSYALAGTLYLGLQLQNFYLDNSGEQIDYIVRQPWVVGWGILAVLFWIPAIAKKPILSLLHSVVFFFFLIKDLFFQMPSPTGDKSIVRNDMKLYTDSLLLNIATLTVVTLGYFLFLRFKRNRNSRN